MTHSIYTQLLTDNKVKTISLIEPMHDLFIFHLLFRRYPDIGKYILSCAGEYAYSWEKRWCHKCEMCAKAYLFLKALGIDPKLAFFQRNMLTKKNKHLFPLFNKKPKRAYERTKGSRDEQLLAFYLAYRHGIKGDLIDLFKRSHQKEADKRKDELFKTFFCFHPTGNLPPELQKKVHGIYEQEMTCLAKLLY